MKLMGTIHCVPIEVHAVHLELVLKKELICISFDGPRFPTFNTWIFIPASLFTSYSSEPNVIILLVIS
jgi:hypothetical protein